MKHSTKSGKKLLRSWQLEALGTGWSIDTPHELPPALRQQVSNRIELFDATYSRFRGDSLVQKLRRQGTYGFPSDVIDLLTLYKKLYEITDGQMTPLIGSLLEDAGYDAGYSFVPKKLGEVLPFEALGWSGDTTIAPTAPVVLDVGAAGKGHLVDILAKLLEDAGVATYTIDASGDIKSKGRKEVIGLEHPLDATKIIGTVNLQNKSLCASAINRRRWRAYHHVLNARTKLPTETLLAAWVIAKDTLTADGLATALFFVPASELAKEFNFTYVTIDANGAIDCSPNFDGELFI